MNPTYGLSVNPPVRPGVVYVTHTLTHTYTEEELMFLRRSSLEDDVICSLSLVPLALLLTLPFFSFFFLQTHTHTHVVQYNDTLWPYFLDVDGWKEYKRGREDKMSEARGRQKGTAGGGKGHLASSSAINYKATIGCLDSTCSGVGKNNRRQRSVGRGDSIRREKKGGRGWETRDKKEKPRNAGDERQSSRAEADDFIWFFWVALQERGRGQVAHV